MPKIRALTSWADRKAGDEWDASDTDARLLCAPDALGGPKAEYIDRSMMPRQPTTPATPVAPVSAPEKRRYQRRDMWAQK
jgi:hypothetical protein